VLHAAWEAEERFMSKLWKNNEVSRHVIMKKVKYDTRHI